MELGASAATLALRLERWRRRKRRPGLEHESERGTCDRGATGRAKGGRPGRARGRRRLPGNGISSVEPGGGALPSAVSAGGTPACDRRPAPRWPPRARLSGPGRQRGAARTVRVGGDRRASRGRETWSVRAVSLTPSVGERHVIGGWGGSPHSSACAECWAAPALAPCCPHALSCVPRFHLLHGNPQGPLCTGRREEPRRLLGVTTPHPTAVKFPLGVRQQVGCQRPGAGPLPALVQRAWRPLVPVTLAGETRTGRSRGGRPWPCAGPLLPESGLGSAPLPSACLQLRLAGASPVLSAGGWGSHLDPPWLTPCRAKNLFW